MLANEIITLNFISVSIFTILYLVIDITVEYIKYEGEIIRVFSGLLAPIGKLTLALLVPARAGIILGCNRAHAKDYATFLAVLLPGYS